MKWKLAVIFVCITILCSLKRTSAAGPGDLQFSFSVLSDVHIRASDRKSHQLFLRSLNDHHSINPRSSLLVLNGDLTDGYDNDYRRLFGLLGQVRHPDVHANMGNHEYYQAWDGPRLGIRLNPNWSSAQARALFLSHFKYEEVYHNIWINGCQFIFLSGERYRDEDESMREDAYLGPKQLHWLEQRLNEKPPDHSDSKHPIFIFLHQPLIRSLEGTTQERGVVQHQILRSILKNSQHRIILFSGHTHVDLENAKQMSYDRFYMVGDGSVRQIIRGQSITKRSESLVVEVYRDRVVIKKREHTKKQWIYPHGVIYWGSTGI